MRPLSTQHGIVSVAEDRVGYAITTDGQDWRATWHPPPDAPAGTRHGSAAVYIASNRVVLVSSDDRLSAGGFCQRVTTCQRSSYSSRL